MHYAIPKTYAELEALRRFPANEELLVVAIAGVINWARANDQSLEDVVQQILVEDGLLDYVQRDRLSEMIVQAWQVLPSLPSALPSGAPSVNGNWWEPRSKAVVKVPSH